MRKRAALDAKTNSRARAKTSAVATVQQLALFGRPQLLHGEDAGAYHELLSRVRTVIKPVDIIDEMFVDDLVSLAWEVLRWRRLKASLMQTHGLRALEEFLIYHLDYDQYSKFFEEDLTEILQDNLKDQSDDDAQTLAHKCAQNDLDADDKVNQILAAINMDIDDVLKIAKPPLNDPDYESEATLRKKAALVIGCFRRIGPSAPVPDNVMEFLNSKPEGPYKFATILADKTRQLLALDRYERRAVSRRNRAIQSLDAIRVLESLSGGANTSAGTS